MPVSHAKRAMSGLHSVVADRSLRENWCKGGLHVEILIHQLWSSTSISSDPLPYPPRPAGIRQDTIHPQPQRRRGPRRSGCHGVMAAAARLAIQACDRESRVFRPPPELRLPGDSFARPTDHPGVRRGSPPSLGNWFAAGAVNRHRDRERPPPLGVWHPAFTAVTAQKRHSRREPAVTEDLIAVHRPLGELAVQ